jgi:formate hydrogenlyase subunit 3/multisubunit Na+/H+ antiporter MnhD subunit
MMATLGFAGALLHTFFHSLFKALLFYLSGNILCASHTLEADQLGGLAKAMPRSAACFLIGTFAISALPIGNAFISEFSIYTGLLSAMAAHDLPAIVDQCGSAGSYGIHRSPGPDRICKAVWHHLPG